ncbi:MAG: AMP-binding protein, partial [Acidobacteria bacterium]|nr:AMP-binding protein [Acidobacteriota bacterium]
QVLVEWSGGPVAERSPETVVSRFLELARERPEAPALEGAAGELVSYGEVERRARRWADELRRRGVGREVVVALCLERSIELVLAALAVVRAGGAYLPLDPAHPAERLVWMARDAGARLVVTTGEVFGAVGLEVITPGVLDSGPGISTEPLLPPSPDDLAYVIYTSGSTGQPKGTLLAHRGLASLIAWHGRAHDVGPGTRSTLLAGVGFDASVWELWSALALG